MRFLPLFLCLSLSACAHMRPTDEIKLPSKFPKECQGYWQPTPYECKTGGERIELVCALPNGKHVFAGFTCLSDLKPVHEPVMDKIHSMDIMRPGVSF